MQQQLTVASCLELGSSWSRVATRSPGGAGSLRGRRGPTGKTPEVGLGQGVEAQHVWVTS